MAVNTIEEALSDWSWLIKIDARQVKEISCLGDLIFEDASGRAFILDVGAGEVREYNEVEQQMVANQSILIGKFESQGLKLDQGKCYGLKPQCIFKEYIVENLYVANIPEYVGFMGSFHEQIKDLPDGAAVRLKVK